MKLSIVAILLGVAFAGPYGALDYAKSWKEEIAAFDWSEINHVVAFEDWKLQFNKKYATLDEEASHFMTWLSNWEMIQDHNVNSGRSFKMKMNQFSDLTGEEFKLYIHGHSGSCIKNRPAFRRAKMHEVSPDVKAPTSIDWTNMNGKSYVTPVKNQGQCGSCWAFSSTGSIESQSAIKNGWTGSQVISLSEQQLVDCSTAEGNMGCNGGLMDYAFEYVMKSGGLCTEQEYPYTARNGKCQASTCGKMYDPIKSYVDVQHDSESSLMSAVAMGPVSIAIEADQSAFQFYSSGILDGLCGTRLDHGVLAVGYGSMSGKDYWKVKNSWGTSWGEQGYVLICRNCNKNGAAGECGILEEPSYPTV